MKNSTMPALWLNIYIYSYGKAQYYTYYAEADMQSDPCVQKIEIEPDLEKKYRRYSAGWSRIMRTKNNNLFFYK